MEFNIDDEYLTSITIKKNLHCSGDTEQDLFDELKYGKSYSISSDDHPEFAKLRNKLADLGYIVIERGWWNGDSVTKSFTLNGKKFNKDEHFPCAAAMRTHLKYMRR